jgi:hypothetical protein
MKKDVLFICIFGLIAIVNTILYIKDGMPDLITTEGQIRAVVGFVIVLLYYAVYKRARQLITKLLLRKY